MKKWMVILLVTIATAAILGAVVYNNIAGVSEKESALSTPTSDGSNYYLCELSWPQKVLEKETGKIEITCPKFYPWCYSKDLSKEGAGCCETVNEQTLEYTNCKTVAELKEP